VSSRSGEAGLLTKGEPLYRAFTYLLTYSKVRRHLVERIYIGHSTLKSAHCTNPDSLLYPSITHTLISPNLIKLHSTDNQPVHKFLENPICNILNYPADISVVHHAGPYAAHRPITCDSSSYNRHRPYGALNAA